MSKKQPKSDVRKQAIAIIKNHDGIIRTSEAIRAGIHPRTLYRLRDEGIIEKLSRGLYCLAEKSPISNIDLLTVAKKSPRAVICLISALSFHEITTQVPHAVHIAFERGMEPVRLKHPPILIHWFGTKAYSSGIEEREIEGIAIKIYNPEKTIADCFKFRNKIGMDIVLEALKLYRERKEYNLDKLMEYARICRVEKIMRPYLEATF